MDHRLEQARLVVADVLDCARHPIAGVVDEAVEVEAGHHVLHAAASVTSSSTVSTSTPRSAVWCTTFAFCGERTEPTEWKPRFATSTTVASPMPELRPS